LEFITARWNRAKNSIALPLYYVSTSCYNFNMYAIKALYDGTDFKPKEPIPINGEYEVVITFTSPVKNAERHSRHFSIEEKESLRKSLFGVLPSNINLDEAREERLR